MHGIAVICISEYENVLTGNPSPQTSPTPTTSDPVMTGSKHCWDPWSARRLDNAHAPAVSISSDFGTDGELHEHSPEDQIIAYCANPPPESVLAGAEGSNKVVRLSQNAVVKFGIGVTADEANNQREAYKVVDQAVVRIPQVYRFFSDNRNLGYLVMEYMDGTVRQPLEEPFYIKRVANVLAHLASLHGNVPGCLSGGPCQGLLFPDAERLVFGSVQEMERWFNSRLLPHQPKLSFHGCDLVLCHLDIAPRNILWGPGDSVCLLDWASAGYYPRFFEFCSQKVIWGKEGNFNQLVLDSMDILTDNESTQAKLVLRAWKNFQTYYL
jgi:serine/threonine protein kinase